MHNIDSYKGYRIILDGKYSMYNIHSIGPGKIPNVLAGYYLPASKAMQAIDTYLSDKEKNNAKTDRKSGG